MRQPASVAVAPRPALRPLTPADVARAGDVFRAAFDAIRAADGTGHDAARLVRDFTAAHPPRTEPAALP